MALELNTKLIESFGELEQLCNQIYGSKHGVTCYIEEMETKYLLGSAKIDKWNWYIQRLKDVRHKRNKLSHGEVSFGSSWAGETDVAFTVEFKNKIMTQTDPLTVLKKLSYPKKIDYKKTPIPDKSYQIHKRNKSEPKGCLYELLLILGIMLVVAIIFVFI